MITVAIVPQTITQTDKRHHHHHHHHHHPPCLLLLHQDNDRSLETMGLDFQRSFVGALVQSTVVTMVVSHAALVRMTTHNSSEVDNLLLEWLCAKYSMYN